MFFYLISLLILITDQIIKQAVSLYPLGKSISIVPGLLYFTYIKNKGAAFGLFLGQRYFLIFIVLVVVGAVLYFYHRIKEGHYGIKLALSFIFGGSLGNLLDRIFRGYVIDFIDIKIWPVFNLADIFVNVGVSVLIILLLFPKLEEKCTRYFLPSER